MKNIKHQGCITLVEESIERNGRERLKKTYIGNMGGIFSSIFSRNSGSKHLDTPTKRPPPIGD